MPDQLEGNKPGRGGGFRAHGVAGDDLTLVAGAGFGDETWAARRIRPRGSAQVAPRDQVGGTLQDIGKVGGTELVEELDSEVSAWLAVQHLSRQLQLRQRG